MKSKDKILVSAAALVIALVNLASCTAPTPEVITEKIIETVLVEKEGQTVVETVEVDKIVTVTPVPTESDEVDPVTVKILVGFGTGTTPEQQALHTEIQEQFNSKHENIQIEYMYVDWSERISKYTTMLAANQPPDILMPIGVGGLQNSIGVGLT